MIFELSSTLNVGKRRQTFCDPDAGSAFKRDSTITKLDHHNIKSSDYPQRLSEVDRSCLTTYAQ